MVIRMSMEQLKKDVISAGKYITESANKATNYATVRLNLKEKEDLLNTKYIEIGKETYEKNKNKKEYAEIAPLYEEVERMKKELASIKDTKVCARCASVQDKNNTYCSDCGAKL